jgi:hypothetical protein
LKYVLEGWSEPAADGCQGGEALPEMQLAGSPGQYDFEFVNPAGPDGSGTVSIILDLPDATPPASIAQSNDPWQLGVALVDIGIVESN